MSLFDFFRKKEFPVSGYVQFWEWFMKNEKTFFEAIKNQDTIHSDFFDKLEPKLAGIRDGFYYLAGMLDSSTAELVITAEGNIKNIVFVEELVNAAPVIKGWKFTALKPALEIKDVSISMDKHTFNNTNLFFYANDIPGYPDEISITVVHTDYNEYNKNTIKRGSMIFLDNFLGELNFATSVDDITFSGLGDAKNELVPIEKLKAYLIWREKEYIEKYEGFRRLTEEDEFVLMEAQLANGNPVMATINKSLMGWDSKASHPWIAKITMPYKGNKNDMPDAQTFAVLQAIEDDIEVQLKDFDGYLKVVRKTGNGSREQYFACKEFRQPSKVIDGIMNKYAARLPFTFIIYKDKYWQSLRHFE